MKFLKSNVNAIWGITLIILLLFSGILQKCGYFFEPKNDIVLLVIFLCFSVTATIFSVMCKYRVSKISRYFAYFMPLICVFYIITVCSFISASPLICMIIYSVIIISSAVVFCIYSKKMWLRILNIFFAVFLVLIICFVGLLNMFADWFGEKTVIQSINSPDNAYNVSIVSHDQGALGGDTYIYARNIKKDINLLIGSFKMKEELLWSGSWGANPVLEWVDDNNILIDRKNYPVGSNTVYELDT